MPGPCALGLALQVCSLVASWAPLGRPHPSKTARVPLSGLSALHPPRLQEGTVKGHMAGSEVSLMTPAGNQQRFPERFRRGSRDLGPGREGPSSLRVTWKEGKMGHSTCSVPSPPCLCCWYLWELLGGGCGKGVPSTGPLGAAHLTAGAAWGVDEGARRAGPAGLGRRAHGCCSPAFNAYSAKATLPSPCSPGGGWAG